jgi:hypothetical protein
MANAIPQAGLELKRAPLPEGRNRCSQVVSLSKGARDALSHVAAAPTRSVVVPMVTVVPADPAQAVIGPDQPATWMIVIGVVVAIIIRVIAAADKEVPMMMMVEKAAVMEAGETCSAAVPSATAAMECMEATAVEASAVETSSSGVKATSSGVKASATMEAAATAMETTASTMESTAATMETPAAVDFSDESVGCAVRLRRGLRRDERHRHRGPVRRRHQDQHRSRKAEQAEPAICHRRHP